jgi:hypothetical protein
MQTPHSQLSRSRIAQLTGAHAHMAHDALAAVLHCAALRNLLAQRSPAGMPNKRPV